jgi:hypothetical protein
MSVPPGGYWLALLTDAPNGVTYATMPEVSASGYARLNCAAANVSVDGSNNVTCTGVFQFTGFTYSTPVRYIGIVDVASGGGGTLTAVVRLKHRRLVFGEVTDTLRVVNPVFGTGLSTVPILSTRRKYLATVDGMLPYQYNLHRMDVLSAWRYSMGDQDFWVSVHDNGLMLGADTWPEMAQGARQILAWDPVNNVQVAPASYGTGDSNSEHGNACAAVIGGAADKASPKAGAPPGFPSGPVGIAPDCSLLAMFTDYTAVPMVAAFGVDTSRGIKLSSNSWGGSTSPALNTAMQAAASAGMLMVFAAGNNGTNDLTGNPPGNTIQGAPYYGMNVSCLQQESDDRLVEYSNFGTPMGAAPGHQVPVPFYTARPVISAFTQDTHDNFMYASAGATSATWAYNMFNGTSCACPNWVGVTALAWSVNPALTAAQIRTLILSTTDKMQSTDSYVRLPTASPYRVGVPNACKATLSALTTTPVGAGLVLPYVNFFQTPSLAGACMPLNTRGYLSIAGGVAQLDLYGTVLAEVTGFSSIGPVTYVELWADSDLIYKGAPRTTWSTLISFQASRLVGKTLKAVVKVADGTTGTQQYIDVVGHA